MQNCSEDLGHLDYDFTKVSNWEHFLLGEPLHTRQSAIEEEEYDEDTPVVNVLDEKHLDMPISWGLRIYVPHNGKVLCIVTTTNKYLPNFVLSIHIFYLCHRFAYINVGKIDELSCKRLHWKCIEIRHI